MVNVWDFARDLPKVEVTLKNGSVFVGEVIHVSDAEELETDEDYITVENRQDGIRMFAESEIESIERV